MRSRRSAIFVLITASLVALAGTAHAVVYDISVKNRFFCCTAPAAFLAGAPKWKGESGYHSVVATASVMGTAIKLGKGHAAHFYSMFTTPDHPAASLKTVKATFSVINGAGTLVKGGGNMGSFSFCPKAIGPGPGACLFPFLATPASFNGRINVTPGPKKFGGTLAILAGPGGIGGSKTFVHRFFSGTMTMGTAIKSIFQPLSPIGALTPAKYKAGIQASYTLPYGGMFPGMLWQNGAGPFTTGTVTVEVSMGGAPPTRSVVLMGFDMRTPMGLGSIQLVSGLLANKVPGPGSFPLGWQMHITFVPEPSPSLGLAAGALVLLRIGLQRARRSVRAGE